MIFTDRTEAGRQLADALAADPLVRDAERLVVLAVPRGGLPVGAEVSRRLAAPLDVVVTRRLRVPHDPEIGFGGVGADGHVEIDQDTVARLGLTREEVETEIEDRRGRVARRLELYRRVIPAAELDGAVAIVVDDGIASGATAHLACGLARRGGAAQVVLAVPVAPDTAEETLAGAADRVLVLTTPAEFLAVSQAYQDFPRLDDDDVLAILEELAGSSASR